MAALLRATRPLPPTLRCVALSRSRWPDMAPMMPTPVSYASSSTCDSQGSVPVGQADNVTDVGSLAHAVGMLV